MVERRVVLGGVVVVVGTQGDDRRLRISGAPEAILDRADRCWLARKS